MLTLNPLAWIARALNLFLAPTPRYITVNGSRLPCREGGWAMLTVAGLGVANSIIQGNKASGMAEDQLNQNKAIEQQQLDLANEQDHRSKLLFSRYMNTFVPIQNQFIKQLMTPVNADVAAGQAAGDVQQAAGSEAAAQKRAQAAMGLNPTSGNAMALNRETMLDTTAARAGAATSARRWAEGENLRRRGLAASMGDSLIGGAGSFAGTAGQGYDAAGNNSMRLAGVYSDKANQYGYAAGNLIGDIYSNYGKPGWGFQATDVNVPAPSASTPIAQTSYFDTPPNLVQPVSPPPAPTG